MVVESRMITLLELRVFYYILDSVYGLNLDEAGWVLSCNWESFQYNGAMLEPGGDFVFYCGMVD